MKCGPRTKVGLYENWCDTPVPHLKSYKIKDIISFDIMTQDTNEVIVHQENPDYKNNKGENDE